MVYNFLNGNIKTAIELQLNTLDLTSCLFSEVNPIPIKEAYNILGYDVGIPRLPLIRMSDETRENLIQEMKKYGLIEVKK